LLTASIAGAQTIVLDNFNTGTVAGGTKSGSSWVGQTTLNGTALVVGGTAANDNGWEDTGLTLDLSAMNYIFVTGQRDAGHDAGNSFVIEFLDGSLNAQQFTVSTSSFLVGSMSTVQITISGWGAVNPADITDWSFGGGTAPPGSLPFRMTFDNLSVSASPIPEPSTYAAMVGALALGLAVWRRRSVVRA
jgi:hypothetical protein